MPRKGRGRRVAAKQAQLGQKKKHGRGPSGIPLSATDTASAAPQPAPASPGAPAPRPLVAAGAGAAPATAHAHASKIMPTAARAATAGPQPLVYSYIRPEIRRILTLSGLIIAAIVVLSLFLN